MIKAISRCGLAVVLGLSGFHAHGDWLEYKPLEHPESPRGIVWSPIISFFLPGFGQYQEGQTAAGLTYSALGVTGVGLAMNAAQQMESGTNTDHLDRLGNTERQYMYGMQLYMFSGELSSYSTFQTAVQTLKPLGQFTFITHDEDSVTDLLVAPFEFGHLLRPTTFIPLGLLAGLIAAGLEDGDGVDLADSAFVGGVSYNAGVGEEAFFRGYLMPYMRQSWNSDFWSNTAQAVVFGAAHYSSANRFPLAQALMGYYLGWLTQRNGWSVRQSAFLHAWWDVIALGAQIAHENGKNAVAKPLPLVTLTF